MSTKKNKIPPSKTTLSSHDDRSKEIVMARGVYIQTKIQDQSHAKQQIAIHVASNYVKNFDAVILDSGSTAEIIAEQMFEKRIFLSVLTNNMGAYAAYTRARVSKSNELLMTGGRYDDVYESLLGEGGFNIIKEFIPNIVIIGTSGIRCEEGIFCHGYEERAIKKILWTKPTDIRLVATDWTKIGKRDAHFFGPVEHITANTNLAVVVTSRPPNAIYDQDPEKAKEFENQIRKMKKYNVKVDIVDFNSSKSDAE